MNITCNAAITHLVIQKALDGKAVDWLEPVVDEQYPQLADALAMGKA